MELKKINKYKLMIFFITIIFFPYLFLYMDKQKDIFNYLTISIISCYTPALGVSLGIYFFEKEKLKQKNKLIIIGFIVTFAILLLTYVNVLSKEVMEYIFNIVAFVISLSLIVFSLFDHSDDIYKLNNKNNKCIYLLLTIFALYFVAALIVSEFSILSITMFLICIVSSAMGIVSFWGEEYGWRGYLQDILQEKFGKRFGVIILGIIWELWHCPIEIIWRKDLYVLDVFTHILRLIFVISLAIVMGYIYMKTKNIWAIIIIHIITNSMHLTSLEFSDKIIWTTETIMNNSQMMIYTIVVFILSVIFSSYIFTKEYKK